VRLIDNRYGTCIEGSSNKYYALALFETDAGEFAVDYRNGPLGAPEANPWKVKQAPTSEALARKAFDATWREKGGGKYREQSVIPPFGRHPSAGAGGVVFIGNALPARVPEGFPPAFQAALAAQDGDLSEAIRNPHLWAVEEKFDGVRCQLTFSPDGTISIRNRYGSDKDRIANTVGVEAAARALAAVVPQIMAGSIIDGELVAATWADTIHLTGSAGRTEDGLRFVAFDLPYFGGTDIRRERWDYRRSALEDLAESFLAPFALSPLLRPVAGLAERIWEEGGEGLVIKQVDAPYVPGGRFSWFKIKERRSTEGVITGLELGRGATNTNRVATIRVGQYRNGVLIDVVGVSGLTRAESDSLDNSVIGAVIEFEYRKRTDSSYLDPRFLRFRPDKPATACTF
jgi:ATP-dependent DNA ligase